MPASGEGRGILRGMSEGTRPGEEYEMAPNQHAAKEDPRDLRIPLTLEEEVKALREQVTALQARGTEQLMRARAIAFEAAARECEGIAVAFPQNGQIQKYMPLCAEAIRLLAKR
jgi:hypothetical protein